MSLTSIQRDFFVKAGMTVLGTNEVTSSTGSTSSLQVNGGASIAKNLIVGTNATIYGVLTAIGDSKLAVTTASQLTVTGRSTLGEVTAGATTATTLTVTGNTFLGPLTATITTATTLTVSGRSTLGEVTAGATTATSLSVGIVTATGVVRILTTNSSTSTTTGALQVTGGVGIGGDLWLGGSFNVIGLINGTSQAANNLAGGATGSIPYQTNAGATAFIPIGTSGFLLQSNGTTATWVNTGSLVAGIATTASNIIGGAQYQIPYQTGSGSTAFEAGLTYNYTSDTFQTVNATFAGTATAGTTATGALQVTGGVGIGGNLVVGGSSTITNNLILGGDLAVNGGDITSSAATFNLLTSNVATANILSSSTAITIGELTGYTTVRNQFTVTNTTAASSTITGALQVRGGAGIGGGLFVGSSANVAGDAIVTGDVMASDLLASNLTFNLVNTTATSVNFAGAATAINIGASTGYTAVANQFTVTNTTNASSTITGALQVRGGAGIGGNLFVGNTASILSGAASTSSLQGNALYVAGGVGIAKSLYVTGEAVFANNVVFSGTTTYVYSTVTVYTDNLLELHAPSTGTWAIDDGKDIGMVFNYYNSGDQNGFLGLANDTKYLEWYDRGVEHSTSSIFTSATYGTFKTGSIKLQSTTTTAGTDTGALTVVGGIGLGGNLFVGGVTSIAGLTTVTNITEATSTATGALQVRGGVGIGRDLFVGQRINVGADAIVAGVLTVNSIIANTTTFNLVNTTATTVNFAGAGTAINIGGLTGYTAVANQFTVTNTTDASSTLTGALQVRGGAGIGGNTYIGGTLNVTGAITGNLTGTASSANNLTGGATGGIPYQLNPGVTAFIPIGLSGSLLQSNGTTATWVTTGSLVAGIASTASNITGGAQYQIPYQTGAGSTAFEAGLAYNYTSDTFQTVNATFSGTATAGTTATGALQVTGGVGIGGNLVVGGSSTITNNLVVTGDLAVNGGDITSSAATFNLLNATVTTANLLNSGTAITIGELTGYTAVRNQFTVTNTTAASSTITGALQVRGGVGIGGALYVGGNEVLLGDLELRGGDLLTNQTTFNLINTTATTVNFAGSGTAITIGELTGTTTVRNITLISNTATAGTTATGALRVTGGVGIGGNLVVGGNTTATTLVVTGRSTLGEVTAGATTATSLTVTGVASFTNSTNAIATNDGAVRVTGGVSVVKDVYVGGLVTAGATSAATTATVVPGLFYNNTLLSSYTSNPIATLSGQTLDSFAGASYRSAKYFCQVVAGTSVHVSEISVFHDGTSAYISEYGISANNGVLGIFDATYTGGNVSITWTANTTTSMVVKLTRLAITA